MELIFTPRATRDIDSPHEYFATWSGERRADGYIGRIVGYCEGLAVFPDRGRRWDDILPGLRVIGFERRVNIAFLVAAEAVIIEGFFHGGRNYEAVLRRRD